MNKSEMITRRCPKCGKIIIGKEWCNDCGYHFTGVSKGGESVE